MLLNLKEKQEADKTIQESIKRVFEELRTENFVSEYTIVEIDADPSIISKVKDGFSKKSLCTHFAGRTPGLAVNKMFTMALSFLIGWTGKISFEIMDQKGVHYLYIGERKRNAKNFRHTIREIFS